MIFLAYLKYQLIVVKKIYDYQKEAVEALNNATQKDKYKGLVVIPTGVGKLFTIIYWISNVINNNKKVLWLKHR